MSELNTNRVSDTVLDELDEHIKKGQYEYRKMLRRLCPSQEMRLKAKRLSSRKYPCDKCAYLDRETWRCRNPHENLYGEFLDIDHCYEGTLRYLVKEEAEEAAKTRESEGKANGVVFNNLFAALDNTLDMAFNTMSITRAYARWIIMMADGNWKMPREAVKSVRETLDWLNDTLEEAQNAESTDVDGK